MPARCASLARRARYVTPAPSSGWTLTNLPTWTPLAARAALSVCLPVPLQRSAPKITAALDSSFFDSSCLPGDLPGTEGRLCDVESLQRGISYQQAGK